MEKLWICDWCVIDCCRYMHVVDCQLTLLYINCCVTWFSHEWYMWLQRQTCVTVADMCILDCLHLKAERTFYILDLMHWKQLPYYQSEVASFPPFFQLSIHPSNPSCFLLSFLPPTHRTLLPSATCSAAHCSNSCQSLQQACELSKFLPCSGGWLLAICRSQKQSEEKRKMESAFIVLAIHSQFAGILRQHVSEYALTR